MLPESTQRRIDRLVDQAMFRDEAQYHNQVQFMQRWLNMTQGAMDDEGVPQHVIERVLNRLVYGAPDPNDAHERIDMHKQMREIVEAFPGPVRIPADLITPTTPTRSDVVNGPSGLVHGPHMTDQPYTHEEGLPRRRPEPPNEHVRMGEHG